MRNFTGNVAGEKYRFVLLTSDFSLATVAYEATRLPVTTGGKILLTFRNGASIQECCARAEEILEMLTRATTRRFQTYKSVDGKRRKVMVKLRKKSRLRMKRPRCWMVEAKLRLILANCWSVKSTLMTPMEGAGKGGAGDGSVSA